MPETLYELVARSLPWARVELVDDEWTVIESEGSTFVAEHMWQEDGVVWC